MSKRSSRIALLAVLPLLAVSPMFLAACSGDDEDANRQASGGKTQAWSESTGNSFGDFRGVEVDFINSYRVKDRPIEVGVAAEGFFCPDSPDRDNPCRDIMRGMDARAIPANEFGKYRAYNGEILFDADANRLGKFKSTITWPWAGPESAIVGPINFAVTNPAIGKPRFTIKSGTRNDCLLEFGNQDRVVALAEGEARTLTDEDELCQIKLKVTRLADSKQFKRFTIEAL
jgi:hypothetical protein